MDIKGWGGGGWEGKELHQRGRGFATKADMGSLLRWAGEGATLRSGRSQLFLKTVGRWCGVCCYLMLLSFLQSLFFSLHFPFPFLSSWISCTLSTAVLGPMQWEKVRGTLWVLSETTHQRWCPSCRGCWLPGSWSLHCPLLQECVASYFF